MSDEIRKAHEQAQDARVRQVMNVIMRRYEKEYLYFDFMRGVLIERSNGYSLHDSGHSDQIGRQPGSYDITNEDFLCLVYDKYLPSWRCAVDWWFSYSTFRDESRIRWVHADCGIYIQNEDYGLIAGDGIDYLWEKYYETQPPRSVKVETVKMVIKMFDNPDGRRSFRPELAKFISDAN